MSFAPRLLLSETSGLTPAPVASHVAREERKVGKLCDGCQLSGCMGRMPGKTIVEGGKAVSPRFTSGVLDGVFVVQLGGLGRRVLTGMGRSLGWREAGVGLRGLLRCRRWRRGRLPPRYRPRRRRWLCLRSQGRRSRRPATLRKAAEFSVLASRYAWSTKPASQITRAIPPSRVSSVPALGASHRVAHSHILPVPGADHDQLLVHQADHPL